MDAPYPSFRAPKRRKVASKHEKARSRSFSDEDNDGDNAASNTTHVIKANLLRGRPKGVGVSYSKPSPMTRDGHDDIGSTELIHISDGDMISTIPHGLQSRFIVSGGASKQGVDVDKHMYVSQVV